MRRRIIITAILLLLLLSGGIFIRQKQQANERSEPEIVRSATIHEGDITATVTAVGSIEPEALVTLSFGIGGIVQQINVEPGQAVQTGEVLVTLNSAELQLMVQQADDSLRVQELALQQRLNSRPSTASLALAQADVDAATANLSVAKANLAQAQAAVLTAQSQKARLFTGPTQGEIALAEANVAAARLVQLSARDAHDRSLQCFNVTLITGESTEYCPSLGSVEELSRANLTSADAALAAAEAQLADLLDGGVRAADIQAADAAIASAEATVEAAEGNILVAEANLDRAQAAYDLLLEAPSSDEIAILEANVDASRTNLALAELRLEQSTITTPISGRVANILIDEGEQVGPGAPTLTVVDEDAFHITVSVDEIDISQISVGQPADILLDALPGTAVTGLVADIASTSADSGGVVTYLVTINIDVSEDVALRPGMSATASIIVDEVADVLMVPNWAIRLDRETGDALVNVLQADGAVLEVAIESGLRNEEYSEVRQGLHEADVVVITNEREAFSLFGN